MPLLRHLPPTLLAVTLLGSGLSAPHAAAQERTAPSHGKTAHQGPATTPGQASQHENGAAAHPAASFAERIEVKTFISDMVQKHGFDQNTLLAQFGQISSNARILALMNPPKTSIQRSWRSYRERFLQPVRIDGGLAFWKQHEKALARATAEYGVPPEIIVAIIGVETVYGRNTGNFPVMQALATLGFDYPSRAPYFKRELEEFLLYARENNLDPLQPKGSYAGAMGMPQFMPASIRNFATDFDGDRKIDLRGSPTDAIGSVARFLKMHGWVEGRKTHFPVNVARDANPRPLLDRGPKPDLSIADLKSHGFTSPLTLPADEALMLVDLVNADAPPDYFIGTGNFYTITRYNRSFLYAMAVIDLANTIRGRRDQMASAPTAPPKKR